MTWEALGLEFVDVADAVPGSNGEGRVHGRRSLLLRPLGAVREELEMGRAHARPVPVARRPPPPLPRPPVRHERPRIGGQDVPLPARHVAGNPGPLSRGRRPRDAERRAQLRAPEGGQDRVEAPAPARVRPMALARRERQRQVRRGRIYQDRGAVRRILGEQRRPPRRPLAGRARHRYLEVEVPRARRARQPQVRPQARAPADARAVQRPPTHRVRPRDRHDVADRPDQGPADLQRRVGHRRDRRGPV